MLSELGADVIKIESATKPDVLRFMGLDDLDKGFGFNAACRGRRDITLDLSTAEGRRLALELCATADIVAENNRGGVMASLGLDYPDVAAHNPDVIYIASQGYGRGGPMGEMKAYGPLNCSFAGVNLLFSHPGGPYPCGTSMNHPDHIAGKLLATAALAALDHRDRTGEGQLVEMAQTEVAAYLLGEVFLESIETGVDGSNLGNRHPTLAPQGVYPAAGDDEWIALAIADDDTWLALEGVCGWDHDPALATEAARREAHDRIDDRLAAWTAAHDPDEASAILQAAGISAMTVMGPLRQLSDEHLAHRGLMDDLHHDAVGDERQPANPMTMSRTELRTAPSAPCLGADTGEILRGVLGLDDEQIAAAEAAGALR
jgi:crotonobetainyl-CoA:carnitine CoA-transferase CaiB-like acyl-CoA transferase